MYAILGIKTDFTEGSLRVKISRICRVCCASSSEFRVEGFCYFGMFQGLGLRGGRGSANFLKVFMGGLWSSMGSTVL